MDRTQLITELTRLKRSPKSQDLRDEIVAATLFLPEDATIPERVYCLKNNIIEIPKCSTCGNPSHFNSFNSSKGYYEYCSKVCVANSPRIIQKRKQTCLEKYGVEHHISSEVVREKSNQTCLERYGVDNIFKATERIRGAVETKYGSYKNKFEQTCLKKYGVRNPNYIDGMVEKKKQNSLERYGVDNPAKLEEVKNRIKQTCLKNNGVEFPFQIESVKLKKKERFKEKYGVDNPGQVKELRDKAKQTWLEKYGVDHPFKRADLKTKRENVCLEKYGTQFPLQSELGKEQVKQTCIERYGVDNIFKSEQFLMKQRELYYKSLFESRLNRLVIPLFSIEEYNGVKGKKYKFQCLKCNNVFEDNLDCGKIPRCYNCYPILHTYSSKYEDEIIEWLISLDAKNIQKGNMSLINPYQLDIYLPDYKLAIEFNGLYWHSEIGSYGKRDKNYHLTKTNLCKEKGIQLIHIFEDEWINKQDIVKSVIKNKLGLIDNGIYARECEVRTVAKEDMLLFLIDSHLQESVVGKYNYGLFYQNELVCIVSLSRPRFNTNYEYELIRSCSKINTVVLGGFGKLIHFVIENLNIKSLISYVDKRYFEGRSYKEWRLVRETSPNYFYTKDYQNRESRIKYQKHKLEKLFLDVYDSKLTEWQIMQLKGYDRIWDCGNLVFEWRKT